MSQYMKTYLNDLHIEQITSTLYHTQANKQVERLNGALIDVIKNLSVNNIKQLALTPQNNHDNCQIKRQLEHQVLTLWDIIQVQSRNIPDKYRPQDHKTVNCAKWKTGTQKNSDKLE